MGKRKFFDLFRGQFLVVIFSKFQKTCVLMVLNMKGSQETCVLLVPNKKGREESDTKFLITKGPQRAKVELRDTRTAVNITL